MTDIVSTFRSYALDKDNLPRMASEVIPTRVGLLLDAASTIETLRAEVQELKDGIAQLQEIVNGDTEEEERLRAENEKLRAALRDAAGQMEWLAKKDPHCMGWVGPPWPSTTPAIKVAAEKARAALEEKQ